MGSIPVEFIWDASPDAHLNRALFTGEERYLVLEHHALRFEEKKIASFFLLFR